MVSSCMGPPTWIFAWRRKLQALGLSLHVAASWQRQLHGSGQRFDHWKGNESVVGSITRIGPCCKKLCALCSGPPPVGMLDSGWWVGQATLFASTVFKCFQNPLNLEHCFCFFSSTVFKTLQDRFWKLYELTQSQDSRSGDAEVCHNPQWWPQRHFRIDQPRGRYAEVGEDVFHSNILSRNGKQDVGKSRVGPGCSSQLAEVSATHWYCTGWLRFWKHVPLAGFSVILRCSDFYFSIGVIPTSHINSSLRPEGCGALAREPQIQIVLTSLGSLWLVNRSGNDIVLPAGELFGFNTGTFQEVPSGLDLVNTVLATWVCLKMGDISRWQFNRENDDKQSILGVPHFETNPHVGFATQNIFLCFWCDPARSVHGADRDHCMACHQRQYGGVLGICIWQED